MRRLTLVLAAVLLAGLVLGQEGSGYVRAENPYQAEFAFAPGRPIELRVEVEGVRLDAVTLSAAEEIRSGQPVRCDFRLTGSSAAAKKASLTAVLLLENAAGKGIGRVQLDPFKVKSGKPFDEKQTTNVGGDALAGAMKVYVFVQVAF